MAFCINCGSVIADGGTFCSNCGAAVNANIMPNYYATAPMPAPMVGNYMPVEMTKKRMGPAIGILLLVTSVVSILFFDYPWARFLSIFIIALSIFCIAKNCKLKGFPIAAIVVSVLVFISTFGGYFADKNITYTEITEGGIVFQMPSNYSFWVSEEENANDIYTTKSENSIFVFSVAEGTLSETQFEELSTVTPDAVYSDISGYLSGVVEIGKRKILVDGLNASEFTFEGKFDGKDAYGNCLLINNPGNNCVVVVMHLCTNKVKDNSVKTYTDLINSAKYNGRRIDPSEDNYTSSSSVAVSESYEGVDPDLKAFLDSYEAFVDEYVDFMKNYLNDPGNVVTMLSQYTEIMVKYEDFAEKLEAYDSSEMSTEDAKYYLEVTTRCTEKMLELY